MSMNPDTLRLALYILVFIILLVIFYFIYRQVFRIVRRKVEKSPGKLDDFMLELLRIPVLWLIYWTLFKVFTHIFLKDISIYQPLQHINTLLLIFSFAWIAIQLIKAGAYFLQNKLDISNSDNLNARKSLTQVRVFKGIVNALIIIVAIAIGLLTFKAARNIGLSLLTSAGILGIIIGFAAQKTIGMILAGIQLAITQPIRLDDVVIVEGEWGRIEEITLTYVVVKVWDERRLVLPVSWFLEKPFQNWTRTSADITGTIFLYVDFGFPVDKIREAIPGMIAHNPDWDHRIVNVQVTAMSERSKEIRILLSSPDASKNWDLRAAVREQLATFLAENYPGEFPRIRMPDVKL